MNKANDYAATLKDYAMLATAIETILAEAIEKIKHEERLLKQANS